MSAIMLEQGSVPFAPITPQKPTLPSLRHFEALLGEHGVVQFSKGRTPDLDSGFCLDDNARALLVAVAYRRLGTLDPVATRMGDAVWRFIAEATREAPRYRNVMDRYGRFVDDHASPEAVGRLIWALGVTATCADLASWRNAAIAQLSRLPHAVGALTSLHARAYAMLGLAALIDPYEAAPVPTAFDRRGDPAVLRWARETLYAMAASMRFEFDRNASSDWMWWEPVLTYDVARPVEAMLRASAALRAPEFGETGLSALRFLIDIVQPSGTFVAIGAPGWYAKGGERPLYDQQPLEAAAMVDALLAAAHLTANDAFLAMAQSAYAWFLGKNSNGIAVADIATGACHDAIVPDGLNANMGGESTLAYLQSALFLESALQPARRRARRSSKRSNASAIMASADAAMLPATIMDV